MVDYGFLRSKTEKRTMGKLRESAKSNRVEFFNADLPEFSGVTRAVLIRKKTDEGLKKIEAMRDEAGALEVKDDETFGRAVEMIGQCKKLKKALEDAVNGIIKPLWDEWKEGKNILTSVTGKLDDVQKIIEQKQNAYAYQAEMKRREQEAAERKAQAKLQAELDRQAAEQEKAERNAAKKEGREPVIHEPIVIDTMVVPNEIKAKTESASAKIEMVLVPEITDPKAEYVLDKVLYYFQDKYMDLATKAAEKAIKAGAIGLKGAPGIKVTEKAVTRHRRR